MTPKEIWKPVPGYEKFYECSTFGRIRSFDRETLMTSSVGRKFYLRTKGRMFKLALDRKGYPRVSFSVKGRKTRNFCAHYIVLRTFVGRRPKGKQVCHIDGDPSNNFLSNLRYGTAQDNSDDRRRHGRHESPLKGSLSPRSKLKEADVLWIRKNHFKKSYNQMAGVLGVSKATISAVISRRNWRHL